MSERDGGKFSICYWLFAIGYWLFAIGYLRLAIGYLPLAIEALLTALIFPNATRTVAPFLKQSGLKTTRKPGSMAGMKSLTGTERLLRRLSILLMSIIAGLAGLQARAADAPSSNTLIIHANGSTNIISRNIYGQFSEHLGACIYGGIWVGRGQPHPEHARHPQ